MLFLEFHKRLDLNNNIVDFKLNSLIIFTGNNLNATFCRLQKDLTWVVSSYKLTLNDFFDGFNENSYTMTTDVGPTLSHYSRNKQNNKFNSIVRYHFTLDYIERKMT